MNLQEFRCTGCGKLLGKVEGRAEILCKNKIVVAAGRREPCNTMNRIDTMKEARDAHENLE